MKRLWSRLTLKQQKMIEGLMLALVTGIGTAAKQYVTAGYPHTEKEWLQFGSYLAGAVGGIFWAYIQKGSIVSSLLGQSASPSRDLKDVDNAINISSTSIPPSNPINYVTKEP